jgi:hypothetical protein
LPAFGRMSFVCCIVTSTSSVLQVRELESRMESLQMEVEDFKGAVKLQSVAMDKIHNSR